MTAPAACPKCGTMLDGALCEPNDGFAHTPLRCRDVLHAKLEAEQEAHWVTANESLDAKCVLLVTELSKANALLEERTRERDEAIDLALHLMIDHAPNFPNARAALERLRSHGK